jgi:TIR domain/Pvc16 N-terminal domain
MASIFLSYRRTDSPQACRVYDWLVQRFGADAVFMDVAAIPIAVNFSDFIREAVESSGVLIALIGAQWLTKIREASDPVRAEIEATIAKGVPVLPVLIGNTPMPTAEDLPASIAPIALQNAVTVGVLHDFDTHMRQLLPKIEAILGALATQSAVTEDPDVVSIASQSIMAYLRQEFQTERGPWVTWRVIGTGELMSHISSTFQDVNASSVTLILHRIARLDDFLDLHFILSFWTTDTETEHRLAGWTMRKLERTPFIPGEAMTASSRVDPNIDIKIRRSDEDARQVWRMITDASLRLSLAYVATISPKRLD